MNRFVFSYPTKVYFGEKSAAQAFEAELGKMGETVMLAYGGGSVKQNGVYDEIKTEKQSLNFPALCRIPPIRRCKKARPLSGSAMWILFWP